MRIVIDMQGAQSESRFRGIGRYTMGFAQAIVRNRGEHEVILVLSGLFTDTIDSIRAAFSGMIPPENFCVWYAPGPVECGLPDNNPRRQVAEILREAFLAGLQPDVIVISSLFEGFWDDVVTSIGNFESRTPVSVIHYDLIPLLNKDIYLRPSPLYETYYMSKLGYLRRAELLLAISDFARREALEVLCVDEKKAINISTAIESHFHQRDIPDSTANALKHRFGIYRSFVLYTGGTDWRKNLPLLIEAFGSLTIGLRNKYQLLFAGKMPESDIAHFKKIAYTVGLKEDELLFTGYISDSELVQLYNLCRLFVFPSWHEGFGLPALEAMACGAVVVGANTTSLPEVIGLPEALFDPHNVVDITQKMTKGLEDDGFRSRFREHSVNQIKKFSWDDTAKRAIDIWKELPQLQTEDGCRKNDDLISELYFPLLNKLASVAVENMVSADAELEQIAACIHKNEQQLNRFLWSKTLPQNITWRIEGPFDSSYSLALVNREIARALTSLGHKVVLHSTEGPGDFPPNEQFLSKNSDLAQMHKRSHEVGYEEADVLSRNMYPPRVMDMTSRVNLLHAYGWEESGFPFDWIKAFNQSLQGMTVMSAHVRKIMVDHGLIVPIEVCSLGVDHWNRVVPDSKYELKARSFRFLHVSSCFPRKGADVMLRAYGRAFRASDDVSLVIKTFANPHNEIHLWLEEVQANDPDYPEVIILEGDYTDAELKALYQQCHALVAPSRAEGFGLPMAEAMLSGLAVITTGWSGQTDFCTPDTAWLIDYSFARAKTHFGISASVWAEPDEKHLSELMRDVYVMPANLRQARITAGQRLLNEKFYWEDVASCIVKSARHWAGGAEAINPRTGWVTTWNTRCGIAAYSEHIIKNMQLPITILAANTALKITEDAPNVKRCWSVSDDQTLAELSMQIEEKQLDTLVVQFNYSFFEMPLFSQFLDEQLGKDRIIVIELHSTIDSEVTPHKKLSQLAQVLNRCHRVLVHSPNDMNRLKGLGVTENVALFPLGIVDYVPPLRNHTWDGREFVVASYGFFLPHKGLLELIEAIALLRDQGASVRLDMVNAEYLVPESKKIIEQAKEKIQFLRLESYVSICTDYLSDNESLEKLSGADLVVMPYQATGESSSAAVRFAIASGRPVAVTPLNIFEDVEQAVYTLPGITPADIARGIAALASQLINANEITLMKEDQSKRWRAEHRYTNLGQRLNQMLIALHTQKFNCQ